MQRIAGRPVEIVSLENLFGLSRTPLRVESTALGGVRRWRRSARRSCSAAIARAARHDCSERRRRRPPRARVHQPSDGGSDRRHARRRGRRRGDRCGRGRLRVCRTDIRSARGRYFEPAPGRHANVAILAAGVLVFAVIGLGGTLLAARRAVRRSDVDPGASPSHVAVAARPARRLDAVRPRRRPCHRTTAGRRRSGGDHVPARRRHRDRRRAHVRGGPRPGHARRAAQPASRSTRSRPRVGASDLPDDVVKAWRADDRVAAAARIVDAVVRIDDRPVAVFAVTDLKGRFEDHPLRGRVPTAVGRDRLRADRSSPTSASTSATRCAAPTAARCESSARCSRRRPATPATTRGRG